MREVKNSARDQDGASAAGVMHRVMGLMKRMMPEDARGENVRAVRMLRRVDTLLDLFKAGPVRRMIGRLSGNERWPVTTGTYLVGDRNGSVAVCALTSAELIAPLAAVPGVAIAGNVITPNLGIEKIIRNLTANPHIRFLVLCGQESAVFHPAQALGALFTNGVDAERRIIGAVGHLPTLANVPTARIETFRRQIELVDRIGETEPTALRAIVANLMERTPGPFDQERADDDPPQQRDGRFVTIRPGGRREPLAYDPQGFFVISLDRKAGRIVLRHYLPDTTPAHEMRGRSAEAMVLGLLRENLIAQMSHAGYLGGELAKAETALRLGLPYRQDQPLRPGTTADLTTLSATTGSTQLTGWLLLAMLTGTTLIPYALGRRGWLPGPWRVSPLLQRLGPHYWLGYGLLGATLVHASLPMGTGEATDANKTGLYLATGAWLLSIGQAIVGHRLRNPQLQGRRDQRAWHVRLMIGTGLLTAGHVALNGTAARRLAAMLIAERER